MNNARHPCPVCGNEVTITKEQLNDGGGWQYCDWKISCNNCHLINVYYPADGFYGREYYETPCSALATFDNYNLNRRKWNENCESK